MERDRFLCQACRRPIIPGHKLLGAAVDHIDPHKGNVKKFFDTKNLQTLHIQCHNLKTQREQKIDKGDLGTGLDGWPIKEIR